MQTQTCQFSTSVVRYFFDVTYKQLNIVLPATACIFIMDKNIHELYHSRWKDKKTIIIPPGENYKTQATVDNIVQQLIDMNADRTTTLIGVGGGVVTDITGYVATIYMRGINFAFMPTTLLAMVDAAIGGKNGVDVGMYKNIVGTIRQPKFLWYDMSFLETLPDAEWSSGFAEIIKHACIKDMRMFSLLQQRDLQTVKQNKILLNALILRNVLLKTKIVQQDEFEQRNRKLLNFGHTIGHALEKNYQLAHGDAVAIGSVYAAMLSKKYAHFNNLGDIIQTLKQYNLPTSLPAFDKDSVFDVLKHDKKRNDSEINFILLKKIGKGVIVPIPLKKIYAFLATL